MESIERRVKHESISITYIRKLYNSLYTILLPRHSIVMKMIQRKGQCMQQAGNIQDGRDQSRAVTQHFLNTELEIIK